MSELLARASAAIDAANSADPTTIVVRGAPTPLALAHGRLAADWVQRLHPDAPDEWLLAARAHHLRRWELPRSDYPEGRSGYHRWKRDQRRRHADDVAALLAPLGVAEPSIERVQSLVRRDTLADDPGAQAVEDAACLVFIETQLAGIAARFDRDQLIDVLRKTARKMSPAALAAAASIPIDDAAAGLLAAALDQP
jgi:hypothetical protein